MMYMFMEKSLAPCRLSWTRNIMRFRLVVVITICLTIMGFKVSELDLVANFE